MIINGILISLPIFRNYSFYQRHDALTHVGMIKDILNSGHVGVNNFYPLLHIESAMILQITNIGIFPLKELISYLFFIFYILSIYLLALKITNSKNISLVSLLFASIPILSDSLIGFAPSGTFFFLVPFYIFVFI